MRIEPHFRRVPVLAVLLLAAGWMAAFTQPAAAGGGSVLSLVAGAGTSGLHGDQSFPAVTAGYDRDVASRVSLTGMLGYTASEERYVDYFGDFGFKYSYFAVGLRGALHLLPVTSRGRWDAFAGVETLVRIAKSKAVSDYSGGLGAGGGDTRTGVVAGGRFFITPGFGLQAEASTATSGASLGLFVHH